MGIEDKWREVGSMKGRNSGPPLEDAAADVIGHTVQAIRDLRDGQDQRLIQNPCVVQIEETP
jgi:hypothetical protein